MLMLQALLDGESLPKGSRLALVLTKLDAVQTSPLAERVERDFSGLVADVRRLFRNQFAEIEPFRIAASPKSDTLARGTGVPSLLSFWLKPAVVSVHASAPAPAPSRAFARLTILDEPAE